MGIAYCGGNIGFGRGRRVREGVSEGGREGVCESAFWVSGGVSGGMGLDVLIWMYLRVSYQAAVDWGGFAKLLHCSHEGHIPHLWDTILCAESKVQPPQVTPNWFVTLDDRSD